MSWASRTDRHRARSCATPGRPAARSGCTVRSPGARGAVWAALSAPPYCARAPARTPGRSRTQTRTTPATAAHASAKGLLGARARSTRSERRSDDDRSPARPRSPLSGDHAGTRAVVESSSARRHTPAAQGGVAGQSLQQCRTASLGRVCRALVVPRRDGVDRGASARKQRRQTLSVRAPVCGSSPVPSSLVR